jgi:hypothetical protein
MHRLHALAGAFSRESADGAKRGPARIRDARGAVVVRHHGADPQVFMIDHVVGVHQLRRFPLMAVAALLAHMVMGLRQQDHGCAPAVASRLAPGHPPVTAPQIGWCRALGARGADRLPSGARGARCQAQVDARLVPRWRQCLHRDSRTADGDRPPIGLA